jgi:hypothetical protein
LAIPQKWLLHTPRNRGDPNAQQSGTRSKKIVEIALHDRNADFFIRKEDSFDKEAVRTLDAQAMNIRQTPNQE